MTQFIKRLLPSLLFLGLLLIAVEPALAAPQNWEMNFQPAASPSAERIQAFHQMMLYIIFAIAIFVMILLIWVIVRYNHHANPTPKQFSHNVLIEVIWTVIPVVILLVIAIPSFQLLYYVDRAKNPEMTVKVTGYQWYWGYEYPDNGGVNFMSYMIPDKNIDKSKGQVRMLSADNALVLPVDTTIRVWVTGADVIHSWAVPQLGVKIDAVPGHLNETWMRITKPGDYYGECSQLCGKDHAYMPIDIHAVSKEEFAAWIKQKGGTVKTASATTATPSDQK